MSNDPRDEDFNIADTCCGKCPGACYVDYLTGERD